MKIQLLLLSLLPSTLKIWLLRKRGHQIGSGCFLGFAYYDVRRLELASGARIARFNGFKNLQVLRMGPDSAVGGSWNHFTASDEFRCNGDSGFGCLTIGTNTRITSRHYFDLASGIEIGHDSVVGGFGSTFWTHAYGGYDPKEGGRIAIGNHVYLGSHVICLPGTRVGDRCLVGAGSVLLKDFSMHEHVLLAGNPAERRATIGHGHPFVDAPSHPKARN